MRLKGSVFFHDAFSNAGSQGAWILSQGTGHRGGVPWMAIKDASFLKWHALGLQEETHRGQAKITLTEPGRKSNPEPWMDTMFTIIRLYS